MATYKTVSNSAYVASTRVSWEGMGDTFSANEHYARQWFANVEAEARRARLEDEAEAERADEDWAIEQSYERSLESRGYDEARFQEQMEANFGIMV